MLYVLTNNFSCSISLEIPKGALFAIVGHIGSGKSSFLSAILGDLPKSHGSIKLNVGLPELFESKYKGKNKSLQNLLVQ